MITTTIGYYDNFADFLNNFFNKSNNSNYIEMIRFSIQQYDFIDKHLNVFGGFSYSHAEPLNI